jgi:sodium-dependent phosphate transporter
MCVCVLPLFQAVDGDASLTNIHDAAERFDPRTEQVFKYLQIISAAAMSFAHGEAQPLF